MANKARIKNTGMHLLNNPDSNICRDVNEEDAIYVNTEFIDNYSGDQSVA